MAHVTYAASLDSEAQNERSGAGGSRHAVAGSCPPRLARLSRARDVGPLERGPMRAGAGVLGGGRGACRQEGVRVLLRADQCAHVLRLARVPGLAIGAWLRA